jgi:hypothetical protein
MLKRWGQSAPLNNMRVGTQNGSSLSDCISHVDIVRCRRSHHPNLLEDTAPPVDLSTEFDDKKPALSRLFVTVS